MNKLVFIFILSVLGLTSSCGKGDCLDGDEYPRGAERKLEPFTEVRANLSAIIELVQDTSKKTPFVELIVEENVQTHLATTVSNGVLDISLGFCFSSHKDIVVRVHYDSLNTITVNGPSDIISKTKIVQDDLTLNINSSGSIDITTDVKNITSNISGTGLIKINGQIVNHTINHNNSGSVNTYQTMTQNVFANMNGSGNIYVRVQDSISANITNSGSIYFKGRPNTSTVITGTGKLIDDN